MFPFFAASDVSHEIGIAIWTIVVSAVVSFATTKFTMKSDERRALREGTARMMEWVMTYPFLESDAFCHKWPDVNDSEEHKLRYQTYCCLVFNQLQDTWELYGSDEAKMKQVLWPEEIVAQHRKWWEWDHTNTQAYPLEFRQFVALVIRRLDERKKNG